MFLHAAFHASCTASSKTPLGSQDIMLPHCFKTWFHHYKNFRLKHIFIFIFLFNFYCMFFTVIWRQNQAHSALRWAARSSTSEAGLAPSLEVHLTGFSPKAH